MSKLVAMHGRDHRPGGPDPLESYGGLQFDQINTGDWLYGATTAIGGAPADYHGWSWIADNGGGWVIPMDVPGTEYVPFGYHQDAFASDVIYWYPQQDYGFIILGGPSGTNATDLFWCHAVEWGSGGIPSTTFQLSGDFNLDGTGFGIATQASGLIAPGVSVDNMLYIQLSPQFTSGGGPELSFNATRNVAVNSAATTGTPMFRVIGPGGAILLKIVGGSTLSYHIKSGHSWTADL